MIGAASPRRAPDPAARPAIRPARVRALAAAALVGTSIAAHAVDSSEYLVSPIVTQGEREFDWESGAGSPGPRTHSEVNSGVGIGLGVSEHWATEVALEYHKISTRRTVPDELEWENVYALADQGEWPVDVGLSLDLSRSVTGSGTNSLRFGPLFQKEFGNYLANFNLLFLRRYKQHAYSGLEPRYQAQIEYRYSEPLEFGLQAFGRLGAGGHFHVGASRQVHRMGPVVLGNFNLARGHSISYNAAWLYGLTGASPRSTFRLQIEFEF
ncbi:MAG: hypothetical protein KGN16_01235 [Burkholderiales bacterium]|nr:hypothetical protein [Burkholderiales bacterium]